ncbi:hypothetical protein P153DRAFT_385302 [Dothidotthia symphoricarpi CBS 119687]|uniref:Uncharacterized protein n=1 Tax=Dothidotthia symphoricarpi CBS 119687 TaxID=1392245 RepID=A0A6A6AG15_9PLEO|nr:uncharacterized protein P153DRAFT_385302 [Dothidotthia symphoricarpi CBS 119687]KAF2130065.1 hypothetical protein P153DRAFT_385302 [Dothidotthia symphoricarpi CBS 119687]
MSISTDMFLTPPLARLYLSHAGGDVARAKPLLARPQYGVARWSVRSPRRPRIGRRTWCRGLVGYSTLNHCFRTLTYLPRRMLDDTTAMLKLDTHNMPLLRSITTKIMTVISPSSSPTTSPTSSVSSFEVVSGRKAGGMNASRPDVYMRNDSFMHEEMVKAVEKTEKKNRRISRFREELDVGDE